MVFLQRSRGYELRGPVMINEIEKVAAVVKNVKPDTIIMVDNCYGEFVEKKEPTEAGADIMAGSLIKNPGGGLALCGGYVAGKRELVNLASYRMTVPGLGREVGATIGQNRSLFQGFFMAPHTVAESLKGAVFASALFEELGYKTCPTYNEKRSDIIQAICFEDADAVIAFCQGIQKGSPVDSFVRPEPSEMPGYDCPVVMAAGAFVQGSSIELSADAPIRPPYTAYLQGGLVYEHVKLGVLCAVLELINRKLLK
jgi:cystathionine beta-lyase family protein involved in aluminum resistance